MPQEAIGRIIDNGSVIVGIVPDLRYRTLREKPEPMMYVLCEAQPVLPVKTADKAAATEALAALWPRHFPEAVFEAAPAASVPIATCLQSQRFSA